MGRIYVRGGKLYLDFVDYDGERRRRASGLAVGQEDEARKLLEDVVAKVAANARAGGEGAGPATVARYAKRWIERRRGRVRDVEREDGEITQHVLPELGALFIVEVRPRHLRDLVLSLQGKGLAPRTVRGIYSTVRRMFNSAKIDELITDTPCVLEAGVLPPEVDKDPEWRAQAIFTRDELERLISDDRIPLGRRMLYGLKGLAGLRHGEAAGLRWEHYDPTAEPLGRLVVANSYGGRTKTQSTREMPVHATLARLLAEWRLSGWVEAFGRPPIAGDLVVPVRARTQRSEDEIRLSLQEQHEAQDRFVADLETLGLRTTAGASRRRGGHDLRATFITLAEEDGAIAHILERGTHTTKRDVRAGYRRFGWVAICTEVAKLRVSIRAGEVIALPAPPSAGQAQSWHSPAKGVGSQAEKKKPRAHHGHGAIARVAVRLFRER